jgi:predicted O-linked N-acetylglucosamine transferase (SPINDLY family)
MNAIDYILTDPWTCPPGSERQYTKQAVPVPSGYFAYEPPLAAPEPAAEPPALRNGYVTYGMFQRAPKTNAAFWDTVGRILAGQPQSRLLMHNSDRELMTEGSAGREYFLSSLRARGVDASRVHFRAGLPLREHLALLGEADVALDTFPYNGQTTTCECLWMGVPVITLAGEAHVSRVGAGILNRVGEPSLVASTADEYVATALRMARDLAALRRLRSDLREQFRRSSVFDGSLVTRDIESTYRGAWRAWCAKERSS